MISPSQAGFLDWLRELGKPSVSGCLYNNYGEKVECWSMTYRFASEVNKLENMCLNALWREARSLGGGIEKGWTIDGCLSSEGPYAQY